MYTILTPRSITLSSAAVVLAAAGGVWLRHAAVRRCRGHRKAEAVIAEGLAELERPRLTLISGELS